MQTALLEERQLQCQYYSAHNDKLSDLTRLTSSALVTPGGRLGS
ncbi:hypothetical protein [Pseudomonas akapageensis]